MGGTDYGVEFSGILQFTMGISEKSEKFFRIFRSCNYLILFDISVFHVSDNGTSLLTNFKTSFTLDSMNRETW